MTRCRYIGVHPENADRESGEDESRLVSTDEWLAPPRDCTLIRCTARNGTSLFIAQNERLP
jgi:hypothetical protein